MMKNETSTPNESGLFHGTEEEFIDRVNILLQACRFAYNDIKWKGDPSALEEVRERVSVTVIGSGLGNGDLETIFLNSDFCQGTKEEFAMRVDILLQACDCAVSGGRWNEDNLGALEDVYERLCTIYPAQGGRLRVSKGLVEVDEFGRQKPPREEIQAELESVEAIEPKDTP